MDEKEAERLSALSDEFDRNNISDGYHTFGELYDHRRALTAALMVTNPALSWRSKAHHPEDDPIFEGGYFIVGMKLIRAIQHRGGGIDVVNEGQFTYHYKLKHWDDFRHIKEIAHAPKWDGHTPELTVERLLKWAKA